MKKLITIGILLVMATTQVKADEGMWLLPYLQQKNIKDMKAKGFKLSAQDIYNINGDAIKDAIVIFGGGCTGEIVSPQGLILTNHHCGYGAIQQHSSVENDYLKNGFWAMSEKEEIPTPDLTVTFVRGIEDVTDQIIPLLNDTLSESARTAMVDSLATAIEAKAQPAGSTKTAIVREFFGGNQYLMFTTETYKDVRMVGAPPSSIGNFGGETDNWMWPRHTGDFSIFRVYSDAEGRPAEYSKDNVPYQAPKHLNISLKGYKEGDFAMILGFPGSTERYKTTYEIDETLDVDNPNRIFIRGERQKLMKEDMMASDKIRIQYASKYAGSSNYWKNSIGMSRGLKKLKVKDTKQATEERFMAWVNADPTLKAKYGQALPLIKEAIEGRIPSYNTLQYLSETLLRGTEIISAAGIARSMLNADKTAFDSTKIETAKENFAEFYKDYSPSTDRKIAKRMFAIVRDSVKTEDQPSSFKVIAESFDGNVDAYIDYLYDNSIFASEEKVNEFLKNPDINSIVNDPVTKMRQAVIDTYNSKVVEYASFDAQFTQGHRLYVAGLMEMDPQKSFYPDANFTMRLSYGQILPYKPQDAVTYDYYTTLSGVMAKEDPENAYEFTVPEKLKELYKTKDFGPYAYKGDVPVAFLSNNDITGGNSGSPVMNAKGELLGLAFDGNWEAMSGDIAFEPELQRTISVDIRYVLFIIDKYAGATRLINEMTIVK